jgi:hypothetical protein
MKLARKFLLAGSIAMLGAAPAFADGEQGADAAPAVEEPTDVPADEVVVEENQDAETTVEPEVVVCEPAEGGDADAVVEVELTADAADGEPVDPAVCEMADEGAGGPEVQRGDDKGLENPDVIFQTTGVDTPGAVPLAKAEAASGRDERAADIQSEAAGTADVKKEKKGPEAMIQKGRVFLR